MGEVSAQQVYEALNVLHHDPDNNSKAQANKWLEGLQKSIYGWSIADQILQQNVSLEASYFAAQTMRTKIKYYFWELPPDSYVSLRDSLLQHMGKFCGGPAPIIRQLSLAMADLVCYMAEWRGAVGDLLNLFGQSAESLPVLLEILQELPEEVYNDSLRISTARIRALCGELDGFAPQVMELLHQAMEVAPLQEKCLRCFASWVRFGSFPDQLLVQSALLAAPFDALRASEALQEASADAICAALYVCRDGHGYQSTLQYILPRVMSFRQDYREAVDRTNYDKAHSIARIFVELGESCIMLIMASSDGIAPVEAILDCAQHHEYPICEMTFKFWHLLAKELGRLTDKKQEGPYSGPLREVFEQLVVVLMRHMRYPELIDSDNVLDRDDDFYHYRTSAGHLLKKIAGLIGAGGVLKRLYEQTQPFLAQSGPETEGWRDLEAGVYSMAWVAQKIPPTENVVVPVVLQSVHGLVTGPRTVDSVRQSGMQLMGDCARWMAAHPTVIPDVLQLACLALQQAPLAMAAAQTICQLSEHCTDAVTSRVDSLLVAMQAIDSYQLTKDDKTNLYAACGRIISSLPEQNIAQKLGTLMFPVAGSLQALTNVSAVNPPHSNTQACCYFDYIAFVFKSFNYKQKEGNADHPCKTVVLQMWPLLQQSMSFYAADDLVMEKLCRALKAILLCLGSHSVVLLPPLVTSILNVYQKYTHSPLLYLASIVVKLVGEDPSYQQGLSDMLRVLATPVFTLLSTKLPNDADPFEQNPDLVEDFFRLMGAYAQYTPGLFIPTEVARVAFECAISGLHISQHEPLRAMSWYLRDVLHEAIKSNPHSPNVVEAVHRIVQRFGGELMAAVVNCVGGAIPVHMLCDISDVLWDIVCLCTLNRSSGVGATKDMVAGWLWDVLGKIPENTLMQEHKNEFMINIFGAKDRKHMEDYVLDLAHNFAGKNKLIA